MNSRRSAASRLLVRCDGVSRAARFVLVVASATFLVWLALLNVRLYRPGRLGTAMAQLRFLEKSLGQGAAERMQALFPEGYVFTWALYGLAAAQVARALPASGARDEALARGRTAVAHVDSDRARATFMPDMDPSHGAFYASWSLYLRGCLLRATGPTATPPLDVQLFLRDSDHFALALSRSESPYLRSYPGSAWPADTAPGVAALAIADSASGGRYQAVVARWIAAVRERLDHRYGAMPHSADARLGVARDGPRGESLALMCLILADVDSSLARQQYEILRRDFVDYRWGLPGVREFPRGVHGRGDIDSGPLVLGYSGPAIVVGAGAAIAHGDEQLASALLSVAEIAGIPIEFAGQRRYALGLLPVGDAFLAWARSTRPAEHRPRYARLVPSWWRLPIHALSLLLGLPIWVVASRAGRAQASASLSRTTASTRS